MKGGMIGLLAVAVLAATGTSQADDKEDRDRFQGAWKAVSYEEGGMTDVIIFPEAITFGFKGDTFSFPWGNVKITGKFKIDSAKKPKVIDLSTEGVKGVWGQGIYELEGDTLKVCFGEERPTEFKTKANSKQWLLVLKRKKENDK
jgi:uncharacterized protein (TIGR03067 family)